MVSQCRGCDHLWGHLAPLLFGQGDAHVQRAGSPESVRGFLPRFWPPGGVKPYSYLVYWMCVGAQVQGALPRQGAEGEQLRVQVVQEVDLLTLVKVALASFYSSRGYHNGKTVIMC